LRLGDRYEKSSPNENIFDVKKNAPGPSGCLPLSPDFLTNSQSEDVFGWTQYMAMGRNPSDLDKDEYLILSTQEGIHAVPRTARIPQDRSSFMKNSWLVFTLNLYDFSVKQQHIATKKW
jgi:hypothetical protein